MYGTDHDDNTAIWCELHTTPRVTCGCPAPAGQLLRSHLLNRADLANLPMPDPLIAETIDQNTVALLAGYWGTMKSFIAQDWAASVATGRPWQGREVEQGRVLYLAGEGAHGLHQRLSAWETAWKRTIAADDLHVLPTSVQLGNHGDTSQLADLIRAEQYRFVVVDTLAKCIVGLDENSAKDMGIAVDALYKLQRATDGGTVLPLHHTGKDKVTTRGSSALEAGVDSVYQTEGDAQALTLKRTKRKDGPQEDVLHLKFETIAGTGSGVVSGSLTPLRNSINAEVLLDLFRENFSETGASPSQVVTVAEGQQVMSQASVYRHLNALVKDGWLVNRGTEKRPFYRVTDTEAVDVP